MNSTRFYLRNGVFEFYILISLQTSNTIYQANALLLDADRLEVVAHENCSSHVWVLWVDNLLMWSTKCEKAGSIQNLVPLIVTWPQLFQVEI